jgi:hypothetical protein
MICLTLGGCRPNDTNTLLTTDTDMAYKSAIKGSRSGPYIMGILIPWVFRTLEAHCSPFRHLSVAVQGSHRRRRMGRTQ